jgi:predicted ABC-type transport system involved in lysophospholipase L1 biosynthesis ATPase subunit
MSDPLDPALCLRNVVKDFHGLRPLRIRNLTIESRESVAILGLDAPASAALVDLVTGGSLPDSGEVRVFGEATGDVTDHVRWLRLLDRLGLVTDRAVMLEQLTAEQNLAIPFSLEVESMRDELRARARRLADEVRLPQGLLDEPFHALPTWARLRVRLGRALALDPQMLLAEHPNATLSQAEAEAFAGELQSIVASRRMSLLVLTADRTFAAGVAARVLSLQPATGELKPSARFSWFR